MQLEQVGSEPSHYSRLSVAEQSLVESGKPLPTLILLSRQGTQAIEACFLLDAVFGNISQSNGHCMVNVLCRNAQIQQ
jgi:hypothetical protein